ncbi:uncharacterized protein B0H18DRAFT_1024405 [Fomitopsis serialis]|uniref:uncharacterized protein n=1 Tax=Fomitopsis serialis TaxID=139415 RepID=UPI002007F2C7|nr:uncharacterized protein B0H18DRAFT_1024405 [Neoantrodia serialis]KAH9920374.1 hypothetical protein B0H18DRAFT_1024405 [Neoantrodia serialis]
MVRVVEYDRPLPAYTIYLLEDDLLLNLDFYAHFHSATRAAFDKFDLLLSLDIALELIHADRESLKRAETFSGYPGQYGHRVRDTIEEIFVLLLQAIGERHVKPGFDTCVPRRRVMEKCVRC